MTVSFVFYSVLAVLCGYLAYRAQKLNKRACVWLLIGILTLISGIRAESVGWDTMSYLDKFRMIKMGRFDLAYGLENSFKCIVSLLMDVIPEGQFVLLVIAFVTQYCIITRFWELRRISNFPCMVLCYYMLYFFTTLNTARQFCAVAIVFYSVGFLEKKQVANFALGVFLAALIHRSAAVGFVFLGLYCLRWDEFTAQQKTWIKLCAAAIPVGVLLLALVGFFDRYAKYFSAIKLDVGLMLPLKLCFIAFALKIYGKRVKRFKNKDDRFTALVTGFAYLAALVCGMLGYVFHEMDRIGWYFFLYEGVFLGMLLREKNLRKRMICGCFIAFVLIYGFSHSIFRNSQGHVPYKVSPAIVDVSDGVTVFGYGFDENGKFRKRAEGIVEEDGVLYYYESGRRIYAGLILVDGEYYYVRSNGELAVDCWYWPTKTNDLLPADEYYFDEAGRLRDREAEEFADGVG